MAVRTVPDDAITLSPKTAEAFCRLNIGDFQRYELPDRMAFVLLVLRRLDDRDEWFPLGKWATIQAIESQLARCADEAARQIAAKSETTS